MDGERINRLLQTSFLITILFSIILFIGGFDLVDLFLKTGLNLFFAVTLLTAILFIILKMGSNIGFDLNISRGVLKYLIISFIILYLTISYSLTPQYLVIGTDTILIFSFWALLIIVMSIIINFSAANIGYTTKNNQDISKKNSYSSRSDTPSEFYSSNPLAASLESKTKYTKTLDDLLKIIFTISALLSIVLFTYGLNLKILLFALFLALVISSGVSRFILKGKI
ncbi:hypothetical protein PM038_09355 [Halorubrum ezzemoulense]|uniref:hypothetical protein n=1 Tax=Halorubrum ezzemoulense TaxID=337243 RepID=UPI00232AAD82|nr:hypothetical protein [Halorubrum ezzemoulense]MDB2285472.1 hypothetical protein [Halorubrum ezzemoulense]